MDVRLVKPSLRKCFSERFECCQFLRELTLVSRLAKSKSHIIYSDTVLNSPHTIQLNIYQNFMLCAMKMHYYLKSWGLNVKKDSKFILSECVLCLYFWPVLIPVRNRHYPAASPLYICHYAKQNRQQNRQGMRWTL